jgi:hypothetical protein
VAEAIREREVTGSVYSLEGSLLEVCSCGVLCPCFVGEDPDGGECFGLIAHRIDRGEIEGVDVSGTTIATIAYIPGNALQGSWRTVIFMDPDTSDAQRQALLRAFGGELGGPLADLAALVGEVAGVETARITHRAEDGRGSFHIEGVLDAEFEPIVSPEGKQTTMRDTAFSSVPDAPAFPAKASRFRVDLPRYQMQWSYEGHNATQTAWRMEHRG